MRRILCVLLALAMLAGLGGCARQPQRQSAPINDLSRGCNAEEVYKMALITAALI